MPVRVVESSATSPAPGQDANPGHALPPTCTLLSVGQTFAGTQNVSSSQKDEAWKVNVRIQGFDPAHGYLCGIMEALNVPYAETPVVTFWEGEIIDSKNYTFYTGKWEATPDDDVKHWSQFSSFLPLLSQVKADGGRSLDLSNYPYIFMVHKSSVFVGLLFLHLKQTEDFVRIVTGSTFLCRDGKNSTLLMLVNVEARYHTFFAGRIAWCWETLMDKIASHCAVHFRSWS